MAFVAIAAPLVPVASTVADEMRVAQVQRNYTFGKGEDAKKEDDSPRQEKPKRKESKAKKDENKVEPSDAKAWPAGLNDYFKSDLEDPSQQERIAALAAHLDRLTIRGVQPEMAYQQFEAATANLRKSLPQIAQPELDLVTALYKNITAWISLERAYASGSKDTLKPLINLVQNQAALDPKGDQEQWARVIQIIDQQRLFAPSVILFGVSVLPYRGVVLPKDARPMELFATPEFQDQPHESTAIYEFQAAPGPIFRIDFDTVGSQSAEVAVSEDGKQYSTVDMSVAKTIEGIKGPIVLKSGVRPKFLRIKVTSEPETAVLRNIRLFALKESAVAESRFTADAPVMDGTFKESGWTKQPQIFGMANGDTYAEAETTGWLRHTTDALYIGIYAREPRMDTVVADLLNRDDPLWTEEAVEIVLQNGSQPAVRILASPVGARYDSRGGDPLWNGDWQVECRKYPAGWSAEFRIPFALLGGEPSPGSEWKAQFIRYRTNVKREVSQWAPGESAFGRIQFR
ncbi:MAG: hypothetical protein AMXMBFR84_02730 [Candidatus Hydrogenedentota bacterium]